MVSLALVSLPSPGKSHHMAEIPGEVEVKFFRACKQNKLQEARSMLDSHPGLVTHLKQECNVVGYVCMQINTHGQNLPSCEGPQCVLELCRLLLDRGVNVNARGNAGVSTALHYAANANEAASQTGIVRLLIQRGADPNATPEWEPSMTPLKQLPKPPPRVAELLRNAEAIRREWLEQVAGYVSPYAIHEVETPQAGPEPEPEPEQHADPETAEAAAAEAQFQARIRAKPMARVLMEAIRWGRVDAVVDVLKMPNRADILREAKNQEGCAVDYACMLGTYSVAQGNYKSELHKLASEYWMDGANAVQFPKMLLEAGADPNARLNEGCHTAILWAATSNNIDLVVLAHPSNTQPACSPLG